MARKRFYGWRRDTPDQRDHLYKLTMKPREEREEPLPTLVDMRQGCPECYDQGPLGSCTGNAWAFLVHLEWIRNKVHYGAIPSRLMIYYLERLLEHTTREDAGAEIRDGIKALIKWGVCPEDVWPYDISKFARRPSKQAFDEADEHKPTEYKRIESLYEIKDCLANGNPVVFGFAVYESFESEEVARTGIMTMPRIDEELVGGHAVVAVGYNDETEMVLVRNSWGEGWGLNGYFWMPYRFIGSPYLASDFWMVSRQT